MPYRDHLLGIDADSLAYGVDILREQAEYLHDSYRDGDEKWRTHIQPKLLKCQRALVYMQARLAELQPPAVDPDGW